MRQLKIIKQVTNRDNPSLDKYLHDIGKVKLISPEEEVDLARRIRNGDLEARNVLINANLRFVVSVSKQYQNQGLSLQDMINEGNLGLIKAAGRFDETRGFKFISYAVWWIRQSITQAISEQVRIVRLPINRIAHISKIRKITAELEQKFEREPTFTEITQGLELAPEDVALAIKNVNWQISLDAPLKMDEEGNMYDVFLYEGTNSPDNKLLKDSLIKEIDRTLGTLSHREAKILTLYYGLSGKHEHTLEEIGEEFSLTRERIRQIKDNAIKKLKHTTRRTILNTYLD